MMSALVSIIIPSYNYGCYLGEAIGSALAQSYGNVEVIVVDDGSTDNTAEVVEEFENRVRVIRKINGGLSAARNTGIEEAHGQYLVFLDADDRLLPEMVTRCVGAMEEAGPALGVTGVNYTLIEASGEPAPEQVRLKPVQKLGWQQFVLRNRMSPLVLARREVFEKCGMFDPELKSSEDRDMWIRAARHFDVSILADVLAEKRNHGENMSNNARRQSLNMEKVLRKARRMAAPADWRDALMWRKAWALYYFQSALMFRDCGETGEAWKRLGLSLLEWPFFANPAEMNATPGFRGKCALGWLLAEARGVFEEKPQPGDMPATR